MDINLRYIRMSHLLLLVLIPIIIFALWFFYRETLEQKFLTYFTKHILSPFKTKQITVSFVLEKYKPVQIDREFISYIFKPLKEERAIAVAVQRKVPPPEKIKLSFIYLGKDKYVIINGKLYREGDFISGVYKIDRIEKEKVKIVWGQQYRWLYIY